MTETRTAEPGPSVSRPDRSRMSPALAKRFRSGRPCLDLVHTADAPDWVEPELLGDRVGLERWLAHILGLAQVRADDADVHAAHGLRSAVHRLARARIERRPFAADDVRTVNDIAAAAPPAPRLTVEGTVEPADTTAGAALAALARDAVDLFSGPLGHRVRVCASAECGFLFVDASRPGTRRWCSMERCGNLAKVRTHRDGQAGRSVDAGDPSTASVA